MAWHLNEAKPFLADAGLPRAKSNPKALHARLISEYRTETSRQFAEIANFYGKRDTCRLAKHPSSGRS
jgi:hypothetical protein